MFSLPQELKLTETDYCQCEITLFTAKVGVCTRCNKNYLWQECLWYPTANPNVNHADKLVEIVTYNG